MQKWISRKLAKSDHIKVITVAEIKVTICMIYFVLVSAMSMISVTINEVRNGEIRRSFTEYITCTSRGNCSLSEPENLISLSSIANGTNTMLACLPVVIFLLSINLQTCWKAVGLFKLAKVRERFAKPKTSTEVATMEFS